MVQFSAAESTGAQDLGRSRADTLQVHDFRQQS